jgi:hypothetical protein
MLSSLLIAAFGMAPQKLPPVKVFILSGQSNMVGHGFIAADPKRNGGKGSLEQIAKDASSDQKFRQLLDKDGSWRMINELSPGCIAAATEVPCQCDEFRLASLATETGRGRHVWNCL